MCQMRIILKQGDREEVVLENAALLKVTAEGIVVSAMFEQPRLIPDAAVTLIDFLENKVTVTRTAKKG
ncbi:MAG: CooT family nickel-binding protein [bacterium]